MTSQNDENFKNLNEFLRKKYAKKQQTASTDREPTIAELVAEGNRLLEEEEKTKAKSPPKDETKKLDTKLASTSLNPYVRARVDILNKMTADARKIIEKMENGQLTKDKRYDTFVKLVSDLGDKFAS